MPRVTLISHGPSETEALGEAWGRAARCGDVIALDGELGAGKTQLVRGLARGLGCAGRVHSPTFALLNEYGGGRLRLFHLDLYRLNSPAEIIGAGLEEFLTRPDGVTVVEWAGRWFGTENETRGSGAGVPPVTAGVSPVRFRHMAGVENDAALPGGTPDMTAGTAAPLRHRLRSPGSTPSVQNTMPCGRVRFVRIALCGEHDREITHEDSGS